MNDGCKEGRVFVLGVRGLSGSLEYVLLRKQAYRCRCKAHPSKDGESHVKVVVEARGPQLYTSQTLTFEAISTTAKHQESRSNFTTIANR